jgi:hypothetical protein
MGFDFKEPKGVTNCGESGEGGTIGKNDLAHISILLSESEPESVSSDADSVSLELTDASEDKSSSQESDFLSSNSDLEKVIIYFNIN